MKLFNSDGVLIMTHNLYLGSFGYKKELRRIDELAMLGKVVIIILPLNGVNSFSLGHSIMLILWILRNRDLRFLQMGSNILISKSHKRIFSQFIQRFWVHCNKGVGGSKLVDGKLFLLIGLLVGQGFAYSHYIKLSLHLILLNAVERNASFK